jgi:hypothetical protein
MSAIVISGDTSGSISLAATAVAGTNTLTLPAQTGTLQTLGVGTSVASTSGTSIDFTGIPSWAKRITVMFSGVSTNGTSIPLVQLGDSGGIENTGYLATASGIATTVSTANYTTGFGLTNTGGHSAASVFQGLLNISLLNSSTNTWVLSGSLARSDTAYTNVIQGSKPLSDVLTQVRITTVNGTDTFDAGTINIIYEG